MSINDLIGEPLKDNRGTELKAGQKVAFNYQGQIAIGTIHEIRFGRPKTNYRGEQYQTYSIFVHRRYPEPRSGGNTMSKVTDCKNLMVIFEL